MSKIEQIISEIEEYLDGCKPQAFSGSKKIIVEKDIIDEMLVELRMSTPEEIKRYQKIIASKDAIIGDAQNRADEMLADAKVQTEQMIEESSVMQQAYAQAQAILEEAQNKAQTIVDNAVEDANNIREGAMQYTDSALGNLQTIISHSINESQSRFDAYIGQLRSSYEVITANRRELNSGAEEPAAPGAGPMPAAAAAGDDDDFPIDLPLGED